MLEKVCSLHTFCLLLVADQLLQVAENLCLLRVGSRQYVRKNVRDSGVLKSLRICSGFLTVWVDFNFAILKMKGLCCAGMEDIWNSELVGRHQGVEAWITSFLFPLTQAAWRVILPRQYLFSSSLSCYSVKHLSLAF